MLRGFERCPPCREIVSLSPSICSSRRSAEIRKVMRLSARQDCRHIAADGGENATLRFTGLRSDVRQQDDVLHLIEVARRGWFLTAHIQRRACHAFLT